MPLPRRAGLGVRFLAFVMDFLLLFFISLFLLVKILLPQNHYEGMQEFTQAVDHYAAAVEEAQNAGEPTPTMPRFEENPAIIDMITYAWTVMALIYWLYFGLLEGFFKGTTLGKRTFGLRTMRLDTGQPPRFMESTVRGAIKALTLLFAIPLLWVNFLVCLFNRNRRTGHDFICRTVVIAE
ncbi:RDD family protein [Ruficoccus sp. ZRK36]|uniref:RDD family protein n=1 Tax=Ruficoccus sp. ZRK36 TaxID=2866311 RepID=UPI001C72D713|nr:RDD family protein [Ruficoccus sp. ZRK36]QYY36414.1 RDD family protein [Ruficoccus sp. ZRK36]